MLSCTILILLYSLPFVYSGSKAYINPESCYLPPKTGRCRAAFRKYYFDGDDHECKTFIYGGCDGNENRFDTLKDCNNQCGGYWLIPDCVSPGATYKGDKRKCSRIQYECHRGYSKWSDDCGCGCKPDDDYKIKREEDDDSDDDYDDKKGLGCDGKGGVTMNCFADPCDVTSCVAYPDANCVSNYCGGCNADFFDPFTNDKLNCNDGTKTEKEESSSEEYDFVPYASSDDFFDPGCDGLGGKLVKCGVAPCDFRECYSFPSARCKNDYCGGCNAHFYDDMGNKVDCLIDFKRSQSSTEDESDESSLQSVRSPESESDDNKRKRKRKRRKRSPSSESTPESVSESSQSSVSSPEFESESSPSSDSRQSRISSSESESSPESDSSDYDSWRRGRRRGNGNGRGNDDSDDDDDQSAIIVPENIIRNPTSSPFDKYTFYTLVTMLILNIFGIIFYCFYTNKAPELKQNMHV